MRISLCVLAWSLCSIAAAQAPESIPASEPQADAEASGATVRADQPAAAPASGTLYMCRYLNDSGLYTINPTSGAAKLVGSMKINQTCTDIAFRKTAASGTQLFGTSFTHLFVINSATGHATLSPQSYGGSITDINALVAQPGTGVLYGMGSRIPGEFVEISPTTGKATKVGSLGTGIGSSGDLEFLNGQLYGLVNKSNTGTETYLAKISLSKSTMGHATNLLPLKRKVGSSYVILDNVWGLANRFGVLYATMESGDVLTISPTTGIATLKGDNKLNQAGLAVAP
jgi:hypothetical protein